MSGPLGLNASFKEIPQAREMQIQMEETATPAVSALAGDKGVKSSPVMLEESGPGRSKISVLKQLENELIREYTKACGNEVDPTGLSDRARDAYMRKIVPCIKGFHGKFDRKDPNKADSPITLSTYFPFAKRDPKTNQPIIDPKTGLPECETDIRCIKVKMTWQFEVNFFGKAKTLEYGQFLQTAAVLPANLYDFEEIEVAKIKGMLNAKVTRQLLKKAFFGDNYQMILSDRTPPERKAFLKYMRKAPVYHMRHAPNPHLITAGRAVKSSFRKQETPNYSFVDLNGLKMVVCHSADNDVQGRKIVYYDKDHKELKAEKKSDAVFSKYVKVKVANPSDPKKNKGNIDKDGVNYDVHLYEQGTLAVIDDPELKALNELANSRSSNIRKELEQKQQEADEQLEKMYEMLFGLMVSRQLTAEKYREYERAQFFKHFAKFCREEKQFRENLLEGIQEGAHKQGFIGGLIAFGMGVQEYFSEGSAIGKMIEQQAENIDQQLDDLAKAEAAGNVKEKAKILQDLESSYSQMKQFREFAGKFEESLENMKRARDHFSQMGALKDKEFDELIFKHFLLESQEKIEDAEEKLKIYAPILSAGPKMSKVEGILKANNKLR